MLKIRLIYTIFSVLIYFNLHPAFANECGYYLDTKIPIHEIIGSLHEVTTLKEAINDPNRVPYEVITLTEDLIRKYPKLLENSFNAEEIKTLIKIFESYQIENFINTAQIVTLAVIKFSNLEDPQRAQQAINEIKKIPPQIQYRHRRILVHLMEFFKANGQDAEADRVFKIIKLRSIN